jgi:hypothetical protein
MKFITSILLLIIFINNLSFAGKKEKNDDVSVVLETISKQIESWGFCLDNKFFNDTLINKMQRINAALIEQTTVEGSKVSGYDEKTATINFNGLILNYSETIKILLKKNKTPYKNRLNCKEKTDGGIRFSYPLFSSNKTYAIIVAETYCGPNCGSGELFILKKENNKWNLDGRNLIFPIKKR